MIEVVTQVPLAPFTTTKVGGAAAEYVVVRSDAEIVAALDCALPIFILGGGSNLLISDAGFAGRVIHIKSTGLIENGGVVQVAAGENWDEFVDWGVKQGYGGLAPLTGIPGTVGATPIQNVGAYGTEVSELIDSVQVLDRSTRSVVELTNAQCEFGYRTSIFKQNPNRYVVLQVRFKIAKNFELQVKYDELAAQLQVQVGEFVAANSVLQAVRKLRASKGMLLDSDDRDTYSVGSFFLNPRVSDKEKSQLPTDTPCWLQADGSWKVSAAWLIGQAGYSLGHRNFDAGISTKHLLALCNYGSATSSQFLDLAEEIQTAVKNKFAIELVREPVLVE